MKKFFNRALSIVLAVMMCVGMLSLNAFAASAPTLQGDAHHFGGWTGHLHYSGGTMYLVSEATCEKPAMYVYRCDTEHYCSECFLQGGNDPCDAESAPFSVGEALGHHMVEDGDGTPASCTANGWSAGKPL